MMYTYPARTHEYDAEADRYDVAEKEAASRVRNGYCPLCAVPVAGSAVTCGGIDCLTFVRDQPDRVRWLLDELHRLRVDSLEWEQTGDVVQVVTVDRGFVLMLAAAGASGALLIVLAVAAGVWRGMLGIPA